MYQRHIKERERVLEGFKWSGRAADVGVNVVTTLMGPPGIGLNYAYTWAKSVLGNQMTVRGAGRIAGQGGLGSAINLGFDLLLPPNLSVGKALLAGVANTAIGEVVQEGLGL